MDIEVLLKSILAKEKMKERNPYKISIERKNKGDKRLLTHIEGNSVEIINGTANLIQEMIETGVDKKC